MALTTVERELRPIRQRLDSIEEALVEEMAEDEKSALREALDEHRLGMFVPFKARNPRRSCRIWKTGVARKRSTRSGVAPSFPTVRGSSDPA